MGRPKLPKAEVRSKPIVFKATPADYKRFKQLSKKAKLSLGTWILLRLRELEK